MDDVVQYKLGEVSGIKVKFYTMVLSLMMLLSGCTDRTDFQSKPKNDYFNQTKQATDTVLTCLSEDYAEGIKELLCASAKELPDIDEQIQAGLNYFNGKAISYDEEKKSVKRTSWAKDDGEWTETTAYGHIPGIVTDTGKEYKELYVFYCSIDAKEPNLVGINTIVIEGTDGTECSIGL